MPEITDIKLVPSLSDKSERFAEWPSLSVSLELSPWFWRIGFYRAPPDGHFFIFYFGPLRVHLWA